MHRPPRSRTRCSQTRDPGPHHGLYSPGGPITSQCRQGLAGLNSVPNVSSMLRPPERSVLVLAGSRAAPTVNSGPDRDQLSPFCIRCLARRRSRSPSHASPSSCSARNYISRETRITDAAARPHDPDDHPLHPGNALPTASRFLDGPYSDIANPYGLPPLRAGPRPPASLQDPLSTPRSRSLQRPSSPRPRGHPRAPRRSPRRSSSENVPRAVRSVWMALGVSRLHAYMRLHIDISVRDRVDGEGLGAHFRCEPVAFLRVDLPLCDGHAHSGVMNSSSVSVTLCQGQPTTDNNMTTSRIALFALTASASLLALSLHSARTLHTTDFAWPTIQVMSGCARRESRAQMMRPQVRGAYCG